MSCQAAAETVVGKAEQLRERIHPDPNLPASVGASFEKDTLEAESAKMRISLSEAHQQESHGDGRTPLGNTERPNMLLIPYA